MFVLFCSAYSYIDVRNWHVLVLSTQLLTQKRAGPIGIIERRYDASVDWMLIIHADHVVHRRGYCFDFGCMYVCMFVCLYVC